MAADYSSRRIRFVSFASFQRCQREVNCTPKLDFHVSRLTAALTLRGGAKRGPAPWLSARRAAIIPRTREVAARHNGWREGEMRGARAAARHSSVFSKAISAYTSFIAGLIWTALRPAARLPRISF